MENKQNIINVLQLRVMRDTERSLGCFKKSYKDL